MAETAGSKGDSPVRSTGHREAHSRWSPEVWAILGVGATLLAAMFGLGALTFQLVESLRSDMREDMREVRAQLSRHGERLAQHGERLSQHGERLARIEGKLEFILPSGPSPEARTADEGRG